MTGVTIRTGVAVKLVRRLWRWWRTPFYKRPGYGRLDKIAEEMYYEQADRDGCEYPPQWRRR